MPIDLSIAILFRLDYHQRLGSLERGLVGLLRLAVCAVEQQLGGAGIALLRPCVQRVEYLFSGCQPILAFLAEHVSQKHMKLG